MTSVIALDVGTVRVGCAIADSELRIPFPHAVWNKAGQDAEKAVLKLINDNSIKTVIVGLPLGINDELTDMCKITITFARRIKSRAPIDLIFVDESHSSDHAVEKLAPKTKGESSDKVDAMAACVILERYFNNEGVVKESEELLKSFQSGN